MTDEEEAEKERIYEEFKKRYEEENSSQDHDERFDLDETTEIIDELENEMSAEELEIQRLEWERKRL